MFTQLPVCQLVCMHSTLWGLRTLTTPTKPKPLGLPMQGANKRQAFLCGQAAQTRCWWAGHARML